MRKLPYPTIFDICHCGRCNEIVWGGRQYVSGHNGRGKPSWNKDIPHTEEAKIRIGIGVKNSEKHQNAMKNLNLFGENNPNWKSKIEKICPICKNKFEVLPRLSYRQYCSIKCVGIAHLGENNPNYNGGKSFEPYCEKFNNTKREEIRNQYGRKCYVCDKSELQQQEEQKLRGKRPFRLSVHHTDFDKEQGCNGKQWKLVPLCLVCHMKLTLSIWKNSS